MQRAISCQCLVSLIGLGQTHGEIAMKRKNALSYFCFDLLTAHPQKKAQAQERACLQTFLNSTPSGRPI